MQFHGEDIQISDEIYLAHLGVMAEITSVDDRNGWFTATTKNLKAFTVKPDGHVAQVGCVCAYWHNPGQIVPPKSVRLYLAIAQGAAMGKALYALATEETS